MIIINNLKKIMKKIWLAWKTTNCVHCTWTGRDKTTCGIYNQQTTLSVISLALTPAMSAGRKLHTSLWAAVGGRMVLEQPCNQCKLMLPHSEGPSWTTALVSMCSAQAPWGVIWYFQQEHRYSTTCVIFDHILDYKFSHILSIHWHGSSL